MQKNNDINIFKDSHRNNKVFAIKPAKNDRYNQSRSIKAPLKTNSVPFL